MTEPSEQAQPGDGSGSLYVVATPIGNLEDISFRAVRVLREVDLIAAEHIPAARRLLTHFDIATAVVPYHDHGNDPQRLTERLLRGESIALICDAGTPGVSDPGRHLVATAAAAGFRVIPVPGPASSIALWSVSGIDEVSVWLRGFLPRRPGARRTALVEIAELGHPTLCFESPHRLNDTLTDIARLMPEAQLVIGRELTKLHEQIWRGDGADAAAAFPDPRGEFTLLIAPVQAEPPIWDDAQVKAALEVEAKRNTSRAAAARAVARASGRPRRDVYRLWPMSEGGTPDHDYPDQNTANTEERCGE